jgi:glycerophosphoryl diester phosphodiesterase
VTRPRTGYPYLDAGIDQAGSVLAMAHRGGPAPVGGPGPGYEAQLDLEPLLENTVAAFEHAVALGYTYLETDVHATSDGVLLAFHDAVLDRLTDRVGTVAGMRYAELADARVGGREPIPTLASLLERFPDARFNIDIKSPAAVAPLAQLIREAGSEDRVCVGSFSNRRLAAFRRLAGPRVATSCGPAAVAVHRSGARLVAGRLGGNVLQVPAQYGPVTVVTGRFVAKAHAMGMPVHVWTVNERAEMERLLDLGVDGLLSDRIEVLRDVLRGRGQWQAAA